jgi:hypothetical protein
MCARIAVAVSLMCRHLVVYVATPHLLAFVTVAIGRSRRYTVSHTFSMLGAHKNETIDVSTSKHIRPVTSRLAPQSTLRTAPDFCKNGSLAILFGRNGNSYIVCTQSDVCIYTYTHILHEIDMMVGKNK